MIWSMDVLLYSYTSDQQRTHMLFSRLKQRCQPHCARLGKRAMDIDSSISEWSAKAIYFSILHIFYFCLFILPWYLPNLFRGTIMISIVNKLVEVKTSYLKRRPTVIWHLQPTRGRVYPQGKNASKKGQLRQVVRFRTWTYTNFYWIQNPWSINWTNTLY